MREASLPKRGARRATRIGPGRDREAGLERRVVPLLGQEQHAAEEHRGEPGAEDQHRQVRGADRARAEHHRLDQRHRVGERAAQQHRQRDQADGGDDEGARRRPAPVVPLDEGQRDESHAGDHERRRDRIGEATGAVAGVGGEDAAARDHADDADRHVDQERRAPRGRVDDERAERRPERAGDGADGAPDGDGRGNALARRGCSTSDSEAGIIAAAATAWTSGPRSAAGLGARPHSVEAR